MVDALVSGTSEATRGGSSPLIRTKRRLGVNKHRGKGLFPDKGRGFSLSKVRFKSIFLASISFSTGEPALILSDAVFARFKNSSFAIFILVGSFTFGSSFASSVSWYNSLVLSLQVTTRNRSGIIRAVSDYEKGTV